MPTCSTTKPTPNRSEERRVGKECRYRWAPYQAEDGIRDLTVTGVQTCALPICFGGSEALPKTPSQSDPRSVVAQSKLEEDPRLKIMWAGYAFARDFREERGHAHMLDDQTYTEQIGRASCRERV